MIEPARPRRSALYMPASNARAVEKARTLPCDVVILDLEDSVAPDAKAEARAQAAAAAAQGGFGARELVIRINGLDTPWGAEDMAMAAASGADAVLVPKVGSAKDIAANDQLMAAAPAGMALWAMIETCRSVGALPEIAAAARTTRLAAFVIGPNDLAKEMRCRLSPDRHVLLPVLTLAVAAARAEGLAILDGVFNDFEDEAGFQAACVQGADYGFDGKTLIHPRQIERCNALFSPPPAEIEWARKIIAAFELPENAGKGAIRLEGRMVELLHLEESRRLVAIAERIGAAS